MDYTNLVFLVGNVLGMILKNKTSLNNRYIPLVLFVGQLLIRFIAGVESAPGPDPVTPVAMAGLFSAFSSLGAYVAAAVLDTAKAVLAHSLAKMAQDIVKR